MVLSDTEICRMHVLGDIVIHPFNKQNLNPNSVDLTLAPHFKVYIREIVEVEDVDDLPEDILHQGLFERTMVRTKFDKLVRGFSYEKPLDVRKPNPVTEFRIPDTGYILVPGEVYLYACNEIIGCSPDSNLRAKVEGKSSLGRLGLFVHVTAGFIDTGFEGSLVLELVAARPIRVYPNMKICQVEFTKVYGEVLEPYGRKKTSKYHQQTGVQESKMHENY